ncbi:oligosaccharide flippase family protein [Vibrio kanaloae]|uniref:lipopolysaccharide biosynthesis protein n=1 Tax=Vibrio kanaloae TaxID=170673 RepID=UPI0035A6DB81
MSFKRNVVANYISQIYVSLLNILMLPLYIKYLGAEAYGLVGFFAMLQTWFALFDLGLTPTIARETARFRAGSINALAFRRLFRSLSSIFIAIAIAGGGGLWLSSTVIVEKWLKIENLAFDTVILSVQIMAAAVALRWLCGLFRGVITGSEKLIWLSGFNVFIATLRFIGVFVTMSLFGYTAKVFFVHQLCVACIELLGYWLMSWVLIPNRKAIDGVIGWSLRPVKSILRFSLSIAFTSSIWVLVTQSDKLVLSGVLSLKEYGYFTLAVLLSSGIVMICAPISSALMPRMARLCAEEKHEEMLYLYRNATQVVTVIAGSVAITIASCAEPLLRVWTGDDVIAFEAAPILRLYAIGYGFLAISAFPYYLQYALGNLRYHLIGNALMAVVLIPTIVFVAKHYGGVGAGWVWLLVNLFYLTVWTAFIHRKLMKSTWIHWHVNDVFKILAITSIISALVHHLLSYKGSAFSVIIDIIILSMFTLLCSLCSSSVARKYMKKKLGSVLNGKE